MGVFCRNMSNHMNSAFIKCHGDIPRARNCPDVMPEAVSWHLKDISRLKKKHSKRIPMEDENADTNNFSSEEVHMLQQRDEVKKVHNSSSPDQQQYALQEIKTAPVKRNSMQIIEDHLLSKVSIRRLYGVIYLFNGKCYIPLTEQDYSVLVRRKSKDEIISILRNYRAFSDGYRFLASNPDIEFNNYVKESVRFKTFIAFENTLLDAKTGNRYEHNPDFPIIFGVNAKYTEKPADTPWWDAFLDSVSNGDKKTKCLIYEMIGYLLLQGNDGKCFFVLATASNSGKSLIGEFFPEAYVSHTAINDFGDRFSLGGLWKTTVNVSMDLPQSTLNPNTVSLMKTLAGDSKITAEEKYMPKCTALNRLKLVFGTNSRISISVPDSAFWDRVIIVPFLNEVPRQRRIPDLLSRFINEKDDILSKSIPYVTKLIRRNYDFTLPDAAIEMKQEWSGNAGDTIGSFFSEHCIITDDTCGIPVQDLFIHYQKYCTEKHVFKSGLDAANFSKMITQRYPQVKKGKRRIAGKENPVSIIKNLQYS